MPCGTGLLTGPAIVQPTWDTGDVGPRVSSPEFVGRGEELDAVQSTFSAVAGGRPATLLIGGEAGIGKSRLAEEIADRARAAGAVVATGVSVPIDGGLAYGPVVGILRDLGQDDGWGLVGSAATGRPAASYAAMPRLVEELAKTRLFESVLSGISARAQPSPLVLVFEDLHWADSASRELFGFLARSLADVPVLLVATYRSEALADDRSLRLWLTELGRHRRVAHLRLGGLSQDETASLLAGVLGRRPEPALASRIWARSQGNPFLAELLAAHGGAKGLPVELREMILADIEVLSSTARQLLELVATAGTAVDHRLLPPDADAAITELVEQRILAVDAHGRGYRFRQPLVREAVYETLLPGNRIRLHRTIAEMLTADPSLGPPAERAAHWWAAGDAEPALALSLQAADGAVAAMAFPEALGHLERALSALDRLPASGVDRGDLLERAADAAYIAGHGERSVALARAALEAVDQGTDPSTAARRYTLLGRNAWAAADPGGAFEAHRKAAALLPADRPSVGLARVLAEDARWLMLMSRFREAQARSHAAIAAPCTRE